MITRIPDPRKEEIWIFRLNSAPFPEIQST